MNTADQRKRMASAILSFEARRDAKGYLAVYSLPAGDGGGKYEVAGINDRYHKTEVDKLVSLIRAAKYQEAEDYAAGVIADYTDPVAQWSNDAGVEFYLRDCAFNRGPTGATRILQRAVGVPDDGEVGPQTRGAIANMGTWFAKSKVTSLLRQASKTPASALRIPEPREAGPTWLAQAKSHLGFKERGENRGIEEFIARAGCGSVGDPWCAIFVNACLEAVGVRGTRSAMARSFERDPNFVRLPGPALGAIVTMWRGSRSAGTRHVFFYLGENHHGVLALGGNQDDGVRRQYEPRERIVGYWWPKSVALPTVGRIVVQHSPELLAGGSEL